MSRAEKDVDYTMHGLIALVSIVLITGIFFAQPSVPERASNIGGQAFAMPEQPVESNRCTVQSYCDGSRLVRQAADCSYIEGFCVNGCRVSAGHAQCE